MACRDGVEVSCYNNNISDRHLLARSLSTVFFPSRKEHIPSAIDGNWHHYCLFNHLDHIDFFFDGEQEYTISLGSYTYTLGSYDSLKNKPTDFTVYCNFASMTSFPCLRVLAWQAHVKLISSYFVHNYMFLFELDPNHKLSLTTVHKT